MIPIRRQGWRLRIEWTQVATRYLPFADAASAELPLSRLVRLALFQVSVGVATALMMGTLNRVMIVELGVGAWLVALMIALPLAVAPFRALIGLKSDLHRSFLGWKRVPFIWVGSLLLFGGLAIMPFALVLLSGQTTLQLWAGHLAAAVAFLLAGAGMHTTQTTGLALATDLAPEATRPRVVALMYVMLLVGVVGASLVFGELLSNYSHTRLVQVVQGSAVLCVLLNLVAVWKQEPRNPQRAKSPPARASFRVHWARFSSQPGVPRFLVALGIGTAAFNMQDVILEPYGGEVLGLGVGATTQLTALLAGGALAAFVLAARVLARGADPIRVAGLGAVVGLFAFAAVILSQPLAAPMLFRGGALLIGVGGGLFGVGTLSAAMALDGQGLNGLVLGAWGAVQATCAGAAVAAGGALRDLLGAAAMAGAFGEALQSPASGYVAVYLIELLAMFATLVALGPLARRRSSAVSSSLPPGRVGLAQFPG